MLALVLTLAVQASELKSEKIVVRVPEPELLPYVPQPKTNQLKYDKPIALSGKYTFPAGYVKNFSIFDNVLRRRFLMPPDKGAAINFDAGEADIGAEHGGYRIVIKSSGISVIGRDTEGLKRALRRLGYLAFVKNGQIMLPAGIVVDEPALRDRFIALDPASGVDDQEQLWTRLLLPLGFNRVVTTVPAQAADADFLFEFWKEDSVEPVLQADSAKAVTTLAARKPFAISVPYELAQMKDVQKSAGVDLMTSNPGPGLPKDLAAKTWVTEATYFDTANPDDFNARLQGLKQAALRPIIKVDQRPDRTFATAQAAIVEKAGILANVASVSDSRGIVTAVLAGDYGWSGRGDLPNKVGYSPAELARRLLFAAPQPLSEQKGMALYAGTPTKATIGNLSFLMGSMPLGGIYKVNLSGSVLALAITAGRAPDGAKLGSVEVTLDGKKKVFPITYGVDVRSGDDDAPAIAAQRSGATFAVELELGEKPGKVSAVNFVKESAGSLAFLSADLY